MVKIERTRGFGAEVVLFGDTFDDAKAEAARLATSRALTMLHPYDDPDVIAGQGTIALECSRNSRISIACAWRSVVVD